MNLKAHQHPPRTSPHELPSFPAVPSEWDEWFKAEIEISLQDHSPGTDFREVWREADERIRRIGI